MRAVDRYNTQDGTIESLTRKGLARAEYLRRIARCFGQEKELIINTNSNRVWSVVSAKDNTDGRTWSVECVYPKWTFNSGSERNLTNLFDNYGHLNNWAEALTVSVYAEEEGAERIPDEPVHGVKQSFFTLATFDGKLYTGGVPNESILENLREDHNGKNMNGKLGRIYLAGDSRATGDDIWGAVEVQQIAIDHILQVHAGIEKVSELKYKDSRELFIPRNLALKDVMQN